MTSKLREGIIKALTERSGDPEYTLLFEQHKIEPIIDAVIEAIPNPELPNTVAGKNIAHGYHMAINDVKKMLEEAKDNV